MAFVSQNAPHNELKRVQLLKELFKLSLMTLQDLVNPVRLID